MEICLRCSGEERRDFSEVVDKVEQEKQHKATPVETPPAVEASKAVATVKAAASSSSSEPHARPPAPAPGTEKNFWKMEKKADEAPRNGHRQLPPPPPPCLRCLTANSPQQQHQQHQHQQQSLQYHSRNHSHSHSHSRSHSRSQLPPRPA